MSAAKVNYLNVSYADSRRTIVMEADLFKGLVVKDERLIFDYQRFLPFKDENKFRCRLLLSFATDDEANLVDALSTRPKEITENSFSLRLNTGKLIVNCPLADQRFRIREIGKNPVSYFSETQFPLLKPSNSDVIRRWKAGHDQEWNCECHFQYWIAFRGPNSMFVKDEYEEFENKNVTSGGRPESNRQKF